MGRRGPAPKPTRLKLLEGNLGRRKINHSEPLPPSAPKGVRPPKFLELNEAAKFVWKTLAPQLQAQGMLSVIDLVAFGRYCDNVARWVKSKEFCDTRGEVYMFKNKDGEKRLKTVPQFTNMLKINSTLIALEREFGMTPSARARLDAGQLNPLQPNSSLFEYDDNDEEYA